MEQDKELPEGLMMAMEGLREVRERIEAIAYDLIREGELKSPDSLSLGEGFPGNPADYIQDSLDPNVQALAGLMDRVEEVIRVMEE